MGTATRTSKDTPTPQKRSFEPSQIPYDEQRFKELVLYIANKAADDPRFGDTKLNKVLYFSDFFAYGFHGKPITGAVYQKLPFGPAPRRLLPARKQLVSEDAAEVVTKGRAFRQTITIGKREANTRLFSTDQLDLVDEVFDMIKDGTAESVSDFSHDASAGWQLVGVGEDIPYETVFISTQKPPQAAFDLARELAAKYGW